MTDGKGNATPAALGIIIVDEAVYALQEMQPGLEKVYFTLQEELLKPKVDFKFSPGETLDNLVLERRSVSAICSSSSGDMRLPVAQTFAQPLRRDLASDVVVIDDGRRQAA